MSLQEKIRDAQDTLRLAADMSEYYYHQPLIICYSGGKDSDVLLDIAKKCLAPDKFEVMNSHTTVDAPETVYHIRAVFKECEAQGIKTTIRYPRDKDGNLVSMWSLIVKKTTPPTRLIRYCCEVLKEATTPNRAVALGVREDESGKRRGRDSFGIRAKNEFRTTAHTFAMFQIDKLGQAGSYECEIIKSCKANNDLIVNPIYKFTEADVWQYITDNRITTNPLYARGYKRVGCIGCPLAGGGTNAQRVCRLSKVQRELYKSF